MPKCGACEAAVTFVRSGTSEHSMILDAVPHKDVIIVPRRVAGLLNEQVARKGGDPNQPVAIVTDVFTDHHATCTYGELYRRGGVLRSDVAKGRRVAGNVEHLLALTREVARYPLDDSSDARLVALAAEAKLLMEAIEP